MSNSSDGKIIDLANLKHYHDMLDDEYLSPIEEKVTNFALPEELDEILFGIINRITLIDVVVAQMGGSDQARCLLHLYFSQEVEASGEVNVQNIMLSTDGSSFTTSVARDLSKRSDFANYEHVVLEASKEIVFNNSDLWIKIPSNYFKRKSDDSLVDYDIVAKVVEAPKNGEMKLKHVSFEPSNNKVYLHFYTKYTYTTSENQYNSLVRYSYDGGATYITDSKRTLYVDSWHEGHLMISGGTFETGNCWTGCFLKIPENMGLVDKQTGTVVNNPEMIIRVPQYY